MKISIVQTSLEWENPTQNRQRLSQIIAASEPSDLIVLPEMFTTGFSMNPAKTAEAPDGETAQWMQATAHERNCAVTGSFVVIEDNKYYNRLLFVEPGGKIASYSKRHLFSLAGEHNIYTPGSEKLIVEYKGWRICPLICYDLRFPVFSRNAEDYDLLIYVANWPSQRIAAWDALLKARAIENMSYVAGVNRIGDDANYSGYPGHSQVIDPLGNVLVEPASNEGVFYSELDLEMLIKARKKLGFLNDRDTFMVM